MRHQDDVFACKGVCAGTQPLPSISSIWIPVTMRAQMCKRLGVGFKSSDLRFANRCDLSVIVGSRRFFASGPGSSGPSIYPLLDPKYPEGPGSREVFLLPSSGTSPAYFRRAQCQVTVPQGGQRLPRPRFLIHTSQLSGIIKEVEQKAGAAANALHYKHCALYLCNEATRSNNPSPRIIWAP